jgi:transcriptional regulator with XRE-family HTH domain
MGLTTTELAGKLNLTKGRISQLVKAGKLDGCFEGAGRNRRFDLVASAKALNLRLDHGQMMGNGAATRQRLREIEATASSDAAPDEEAPQESRPLKNSDPARYELAKTQKAEEEARRLRRQNALEEGTMVLADQVATATARALTAELSQFENVLRLGARAIADKLGVDFKTARQILTDTWRDHRSARSQVLADAAEAATLSPEEKDVDF